MTRTQTPAGPSDPLFWTTLGSLSIPEHAVVIADKDLPKSIISHLPDPLLVSAGEGLKSLSAMENLASAVLDRRSSRPLILVAVGGGSVGDAVGFLASVLWRGVELWHLPTTLLAMVDSAHGGKTAVNLGKTKNQLGTFYPASKVLLVTDILESLPLTQRREGLAELLKALWLDDPDGLTAWETAGGSALAAHPYIEVQESLRNLLTRAIRVKLSIVAQDPFEKREIRTFLNLGHTVAHALELTCGLSHGDAVAWGLLSAGVLSHNDSLSSANLERLFSSVYPLLVPLPWERVNAQFMAAAMARDKKRRNGELRSVLLRDVGAPFVTTRTAGEWFEALNTAYDMWLQRPITLEHVQTLPTHVDVGASKSELNRAYVIQHLANDVSIEGPESEARDVRLLLNALRAKRTPNALFAGAGGTTLRFLMAVCSATDHTTSITADSRLLARDHGDLLSALREAGSVITPTSDGFQITPWPEFPKMISVSVKKSSQGASAIALLSASGQSFELKLLDTQTFASPGYFAMTLAMLRQAGVEFVEQEGSVVFKGRAQGPSTLRVSGDASSAAIWAVLNRLGSKVEYAPGSAMQPDHAIETVLTEVDSHGRLSGVHTPDLVPIVAAYAIVAQKSLRVTEATNLVRKESNRIEDLVAMLRGVEAEVSTSSDGFEFVGSPEPGTRSNDLTPVLDALEDHRLAFAAAVLSTREKVELRSPWVVQKSYPLFWHDLRSAGWVVAPTDV